MYCGAIAPARFEGRDFFHMLISCIACISYLMRYTDIVSRLQLFEYAGLMAYACRKIAYLENTWLSSSATFKVKSNFQLIYCKSRFME